MLRIMLAVVCLSISSPPASPDISGRWNVVIPEETQKNPNGGTSNWKEVRGTLDVAQKSSDLRATWRTLDEWTLTGRIDVEGRFTLESEERQIPATRDGRKESVPARWIVRGALKDGTLSGLAALAIGDREPIFHKWHATKGTF